MTINYFSDHGWLGATPLKEFLPLVYEACSTSTSKVTDMGFWLDSCRQWDAGINEFSIYGEVGDQW